MLETIPKLLTAFILGMFVVFACSDEASETAGNTFIDAGHAIKDVGDTDAFAQTNCSWQVRSIKMPDVGDGGHSNPTDLPGNWEPFTVDPEPDGDIVYIRRCN